MDLKGSRQSLTDKAVRKRSAAFPFEVPYRLINMYSLKGDTVLDPFFGIGTTMLAAMAACRNSIGYEIDKNFFDTIEAQLGPIVDFSNQQINERLQRHEAFVNERAQTKGPLKYTNTYYRFAVVMNQEKNLKLDFLKSVEKTGRACFDVEYTDTPKFKQFKQLELKM